MIRSRSDFLSSALADISFGTDGNAVNYQLDGWSFPEHGFTWSLGFKSTFRIIPPSDGQDLLLIFEGAPYLHSPSPSAQVIRVVHSGQEVTSFGADGPFATSTRLRAATIKKASASIELHYLNAASPKTFGSNDHRLLAIAWRRIRLVSVPALGSETSQLDDAWSKRSGPRGIELHRATGGALRPADNVSGSAFGSSENLEDRLGLQASEETLKRLIIAGLVTGDTEAAATAVAAAAQMPGLTLEIENALPGDMSLARCTMEADRRWRFGFSEAWHDFSPNHPAATMVAWHWLATLPIFEAYSRAGRLPGSFLLSLGDEAHARGVAFCANNYGSLLIPDPYFMRSRGYQALRRSFAACMPPFQQRRRAALWRGSTTGYRGAGGLLDLPRVRLCLRAAKADAAGILDVGLTGFAQLLDGEEDRLRAMGLARSFVALEQLPEWMSHIDIDGNTNSWPGLFSKLLCGSAVMKVSSGAGWRQWYYDRLEPQANFMPVHSDLSDLVDKAKYLAYRVDEAEALGHGSRSLALSMSYEREVERAVGTIEEAIVREALLYDEAASPRKTDLEGEP